MAGRPTVLTAAVYETLVKHVREGAFDWVAAEAAGISQSAFYSWMKRGKLAEKGQREEAYVRLRGAVRQARALAPQVIQQSVVLTTDH